MDKNTTDILDKIFDEKYIDAMVLLKQCFIYYSSFAQDNEENFNISQNCLKRLDNDEVNKVDKCMEATKNIKMIARKYINPEDENKIEQEFREIMKSQGYERF